MSSYSLINGYLYVSDNFDNTSSSAGTFLSLGGDTFRIVTKRTISASTNTGFQGELCLGVSGGVNYLYYCVSDNNWQRIPFTTF
jgi:hypothetical protein